MAGDNRQLPGAGCWKICRNAFCRYAKITLIGSVAPAHVMARTIDEQSTDSRRQQPRTVHACLAAIENAHQITILLHPSVQRGTQAAQSTDLADTEAVLRTLLRGYDFFLQYAASPDAPAGRLQRVWVFPRGAVDSNDRALALLESLGVDPPHPNPRPPVKPGSPPVDQPCRPTAT